MIEGPSIIEISRSAYLNNVQYIRSLLSNRSAFYAVIKGNAYGHGIETFAPMACRVGVKNFCVFSQDEACRLISAVPDEKIDVIIMGYLDESGIAWSIENDIQFYVFDFSRLQLTIDVAKKMKKVARIHIELETGMNRSGFRQSDWNKLVQLIRSHDQELRVCAFATHFAGAESLANHFRVTRQIKNFDRYTKKLNELTGQQPLLHASCSAAMLRFPRAHHDLVRVGILQYGFWPSPEVYVEKRIKSKFDHDPLKRIISWKSRVMDVSYVDEGEYVGYGHAYLTQYKTKIALIPVGYASGYARSLSNTGHVLIRGKRANVIGLVNMNMIEVDVTNIEGVETGDEVVIIGKQGDDEISVASFSELSNQVNYELLTRLPSGIKRIITD